MNAVELTGVGGRLGRRMVGPYHLTVAPGEIVALVGPNGSGKTTCLHLLLGLRRHDRGQVMILGRPVDHRTPPVGCGVSLLDDGHVPWQTGRTSVAALAELRPGAPGPGEVLEVVGLGDAADQPTSTYSAGMLRRLGLARALLGGPEVLVLDEPTASLDEGSVHWLGGLLSDLAAAGTAVLMASHDPLLADDLGPRIVPIERCRT